MAITKVSDLINPEVMGDMIDAKVEAQAKLLKYAHVDTSLEGYQEIQRQFHHGIISAMLRILIRNQEMKLRHLSSQQQRRHSLLSVQLRAYQYIRQQSIVV